MDLPGGPFVFLSCIFLWVCYCLYAGESFSEGDNGAGSMVDLGVLRCGYRDLYADYTILLWCLTLAYSLSKRCNVTVYIKVYSGNFAILDSMLLLLTLMACVKNSDKVNVVRTKIPHDWVHQPPDNCGVGTADIQSVNDDMAAAIDLAKEYAQIHLAERLAHLQRTEEVEGLVGASENGLSLNIGCWRSMPLLKKPHMSILNMG